MHTQNLRTVVAWEEAYRVAENQERDSFILRILLYFQILSDINALPTQGMKYLKFGEILFSKPKWKIPVIQLKNEQSQVQEVSLEKKKKNTNG